MLEQIKVIAFDADDTLWVNEPLFQKAENSFCELMEDYLPLHSVSKELFATEIKNMPLYGYGVKAFMLSMIETATQISNNTVDVAVVNKIIEIGKELLDAPLELIPEIELVLKRLFGNYRLVMATKGDLLDQERKLEKSGLKKYFHHTEILSEKNEDKYKELIAHLDINAEEFLMVGNSLKSDVLPVLNIGAYGFHIPYHTTWEYEKIEKHIEHQNFVQLEKITDLLKHIN